MAKHQGHKNWNHWNVSLWINNDEGLYRLAQRCLNQAKAMGSSRDTAARDMFGELTQTGDFATPDGAPYSVSSIRAAMVGM